MSAKRALKIEQEADGQNYLPYESIQLISKTPLLDRGDPEQKREEIRQYFHQTFSLYESLFECLKGEDAFTTRANALRHPLIFYYGHTSVFFINKLNVAKLIDQRVDAQLESMLAIGVDEMSWDDLNEAHYDWPTPARVKAHRDQTRTIVDQFIRTCEVSLPISWESPLWVVMMGIEHERIHLETSAVLIRELPLEKVQAHKVWGRVAKYHDSAPPNSLLPVSGTSVAMGKSRDNPLYGWDNEYGQRIADIKPFKASKFLVSNREFLEFVEDDGYQQQKYWTDEGWQWVQFRNARHPVYWVVGNNTGPASNNNTSPVRDLNVKHNAGIKLTNDSGQTYKMRTMLALIDMPWDWPAEVNYLEAKAFCNWKSAKTGLSIRLPTEAEWYRLRALVDTDQPYWDKAPGNINLEYDMSPCSVSQHPFEDGFYDIIGNVWQWTETPIDGFDGFEVHPLYDDFSTPTFDGKHNLIKGGCWISTGNYAIKDSRYAFRRHFFQYSGFRYVESDVIPEQDVNVYEQSEMVAQYIEFHYGKEQFGVPNFPVTCANLCLQYAQGRDQLKAMDLGCATGRSSFELAKVFKQVDALDFSARLIETPVKLQSTGLQRYTLRDEGELVSYREVKLSDFDGYEAVKDKITFMQGDACNLPQKFTGYDLVFAGNLIDRLYDPQKFLADIKQRIRQGGLLIITSPYTWLEEFTDRDKWLGGYKASTGESYTTLEGLIEHLQPEFRLLDTPRDVEFVIRETARKFQHTVAQLTAWEKVG